MGQEITKSIKINIFTTLGVSRLTGHVSHHWRNLLLCENWRNPLYHMALLPRTASNYIDFTFFFYSFSEFVILIVVNRTLLVITIWVWLQRF